MKNFETIEELVTYIEEQQVVLLFIKTENCGVCDVMLRKVNYVLENYDYVENRDITARHARGCRAICSIYWTDNFIIS